MRIRLSFLFLTVLFGIRGYGQYDGCHTKSLTRTTSSTTFHGKKSLVGQDYDAVYHRIELNIDPRYKQMSGIVTTYFRPEIDNFNTIKFDISDSMNIDSVFYHGMSITYNQHSNLLEITVSTIIPRLQLDSVQVFYSGDPTNNPARSYERESGRANSSSPIIWTLSQPYGALEWWPCKQSLYDKIDSLDMLIKVPKGNKAAGIGQLLGVNVVNDSFEVFHWKHRYPVSTYLIATAVTNYEEFTDWVHFKSGDSLPILNYVFPENRPFMEEAVKQTIPIMQLFDSLIGPYPFMQEKYGHAEFLRGGGMEHQTMSFMGSWNFGLIAHELAHQWFGDQVTCGSWSDLWLNEGFATYFTLLAREAIQDNSTWRNVQLASQERALRENNESVFVLDTFDQGRLFSSQLTYNKGAQLLRMIQWQVGDSLFFKGLRNYLNDTELSYGFARTNDLKFHLESTTRKDLSEFFDDWFYGTGNPHYIINWRQTGKNVEIKIKQTTNGNIDFFEMPIELQLRNALDSSSYVLNPSNSEFSQTVTVDFAVDSIDFDPNLWVLAASEVTNVKDVEKDIILFPNPSSYEITISSFGHNFKGFKIYNSVGQLCIEQPFESSQKLFKIVNIEGLTNGIYFVELYDDESAVTRRFVKIYSD
ncbi:MAG: aminopeptidase N [Bacteroidia bacterium]|jgi:aminopeptidase N